MNLEQMDFTELQEVMDEMNLELRFEELVVELMSGDVQSFLETMKGIAYQVLVGEWVTIWELFLQLLAIAIFSAFLTNLAQMMQSHGTMGSGAVTDTAFYITYLSYVGILTGLCGMAMQIALSYVGILVRFIQALLPVYTVTLIFSGTAASAGIYYEMILAVISVTQLLLREFLLPVIEMYIFMNFASRITDRDWLSKGVELLEGAIEWVYKTVFAAFLGVQAIQKIILPAIDDTTKGIIGKAISAVPGIGNTAESVTSLLVGSAILIRNSVGAAGMIIISILFLVPAIKLAMIFIMLRVLGAIIQPICDKRLLGCVTRTGNAMKLILKAVCITGIMNFVSIAIICMSGGAS